MSSFELDTSGEVALGPSVHVPGFSHRNSIRWPDLDDFTRGYTEAAFAELAARLVAQGDYLPHLNGAGCSVGIAFSDLAPESLARIIADCARFEPMRFPEKLHRHYGVLFWHGRQRGEYDEVDRRNAAIGGSAPPHDFPPLAPTLRDDGKVYLAEVQS